MFDTLKYAKILVESGFSKKQAETSIEVIRDIMDASFATKNDIKDLKAEIQLLEYKLTVRMWTINGAAVGALATLMTVLKFI